MSTLSCSRWIFLLSLAALMLISASEGGPPFQALPCWEVCMFPRKQNIKTCFEQKWRHDCPFNNFVVEKEDGRRFCIKGHTRWIKKMISDGNLHCPPDISGPL